MKKILAIFLVLSLTVALYGCGTVNTPKETEQQSTPTSGKDEEVYNDMDADSGNQVTQNTDADNTPSADVNFSENDAEMFTDRDKKTEYDKNKAVEIQLKGTTAAASSNAVKITGTTVVIKEEATYVISGSLTDGMLVVVRQNYCDRIALNTTVRQFEFVDAKILGVVFNCTNEDGSSYGRKYYRGKYVNRYYNKYRHYYTNGSRRSVRADKDE